MAKYKKKEIQIIDMSSRLRVKIVESTYEEERRHEEEFEEMQLKVEKRMIQYEKDIRNLLIEAKTESCIKVTHKDTEKYIKKYNDEFSGKNSNNIQRRIQMIQKYLEEQD